MLVVAAVVTTEAPVNEIRLLLTGPWSIEGDRGPARRDPHANWSTVPFLKVGIPVDGLSMEVTGGSTGFERGGEGFLGATGAVAVDEISENDFSNGFGSSSSFEFCGKLA
jgi:hypothetical protein